jgi:hypothetical protein
LINALNAALKRIAEDEGAIITRTLSRRETPRAPMMTSERLRKYSESKRL